MSPEIIASIVAGLVTLTGVITTFVLGKRAQKSRESVDLTEATSLIGEAWSDLFKELKERIDKQEEEIKILHAQLSTLTAQNTALVELNESLKAKVERLRARIKELEKRECHFYGEIGCKYPDEKE